MAAGDHLYVRRGRRYTHHGIDGGDGTVIHYVGPRSIVRRVGRTSLEEFAAGSPVRIRRHAQRLSPEEAIRNAESRLESTGYHLTRNNCEHFATWCCTGRAVSRQVRHWVVVSQGAVASLTASQSVGSAILLLGTLSAGLYALTRPRPPG